MEEQSIEEKAKRFDESLNRAREIHRNEEEKRRDMEWLFPELKESRDERIRKSIIGFLITISSLKDGKTVSNKDFDTKAILEWVAWLEKQGEQNPNPYTGTSFEYNNHTWGMCARDGGVEILFDGEIKDFISLEKSLIYPVHPQPTIAPKSALEAIKEEEVNNTNKNKVESDFNVGDWVVSPMGVYWHIDAIRDGRYQVTSDSGVSVDWLLNTKLYHRFTIQDAEDGDVLVSGEVVFIFKTIHGVWLNCYCSVHKDGSLNMDSYDLLTNRYFGEVYPASKEQRDLLFQKMREAGWDWDADKKKLYPTL